MPAKNEWTGPFGDRFKIRIQAPPVDGKANSHLLAFLAEQFGVPKRNVMLLSGQSGRHKQLRIQKPLKPPSQLDAN